MLKVTLGFPLSSSTTFQGGLWVPAHRGSHRLGLRPLGNFRNSRSWAASQVVVPASSPLDSLLPRKERGRWGKFCGCCGWKGIRQRYEQDALLQGVDVLAWASSCSLPSPPQYIPLRAWLYRDGFARFSNTRFTLSSIDDQCILGTPLPHPWPLPQSHKNLPIPQHLLYPGSGDQAVKEMSLVHSFW